MLPVSFDLRKARKCLLCNGSSTDQSPLEYTDDVFPEVHGRLPWRSYEKAKTKEGDTVRVPSGKLCLICFNVYRALGTWTNLQQCFLFFCFWLVTGRAGYQKAAWVVSFLLWMSHRPGLHLRIKQGLHKERKSVEEYYKHVSQKSHQQDHRGFLNSRKEWIRQHNQAGPERKRLLSKTELMEAQKKLDLVKTTGGKFVAPKKQFVQPDAWNPKIHGGEYDPTKEVTENLFGKEVRGVWVLKGPKGVYDYEEFQEAAVKETENVHDSRDAPFSEEGLARKKKHALEQFAQGSQAREKVALETPGAELSLQGILETLQLGTASSASSGLDKAIGQVDGAKEEDISESSASNASDEEPEEDNLFGPCKKKVGALTAVKAACKPAAKAQARAGQPAKVTGEAKERPTQETKAEPKRRRSDAKEDTATGGTFLADGRAQRALRNLQEKVSELQGKLASVALDDKPPEPDAHSQAAWKQSCAERVANVKTIGRQAREYIKRMDKSANKEFFEQGLGELQQVEDTCAAMQSLLSLVSATGSSPEAVVKAYEEVKASSTKAVGTCFQLKYALAKASQSCLYSEYEKFCAQFLLDTVDIQSLQAAMGQATLEEFIVAEIESRILLNLRAIKPIDAQALSSGKDSCEVPNLHEAERICMAVVEAAKLHGKKFMGASLHDACQVALGFVSSADLTTTQDALEDLKDKDPNPSGIGQFFASHTVGQSLADVASSRVASGETEAKATESLKGLESKLTDLRFLNVNKVKGLKLITDYLQPAQELLEKCDTQVSQLKMSKTKGSKDKAEDAATVKLANKAHERLRDVLLGHQKEFGNVVKKLLEGDLQANLSDNLCLGCMYGNLLLMILRYFWSLGPFFTQQFC